MSACSLCDDTGWNFTGAAPEECPCGAAGRLRLEGELRRARFPRAYLSGATIKPWVPSGPLQTAALALIERWGSEFAPGAPGLWLAGRCGAGKSHLAAAALFAVIAAGRTAVWWNIADLLAEIQGTFDGSGTAERVLADALAADCVVLDDLGATKLTDWSLSIILRLLNNRIDNDRTTIVTTNLTKAQSLENLGERIASRIYDVAPESNKIVANWDDYREKRHRGKRDE